MSRHGNHEDGDDPRKVTLIAFLNESSDVVLWDIYIDGAWAGSRRNILQAKAHADYIVSEHLPSWRG